MRKWGLVVGVLALAGVISTLLWIGLQPGQPNLPAYQYGERASAQYQAGGAGCDPRALSTIRDDRKAARQRKRCAEATEEHRLKSEDLVQQTRAADAAQAQAVTAYDIARMTLWGTVGGFLTLIAAGLAAFYAREAALAARDALGYERDRSAAELRPWVKIDLVVTKFEATEAKFDIGYQIVFTNVGQTVAQCFEFKTAAMFFQLSVDPIEMAYAQWEPPEVANDRYALMPGEERKGGGGYAISKQVVPWQKSGKAKKMVSFAVIGTAFYRSAMDEKWHRTDRSFLIGRKDDTSINTGFFLYDDMRVDGAGLVSVTPFAMGVTT
jgi:hypothetical protein